MSEGITGVAPSGETSGRGTLSPWLPGLFGFVATSLVLLSFEYGTTIASALIALITRGT